MYLKAFYSKRKDTCFFLLQYALERPNSVSEYIKKGKYRLKFCFLLKKLSDMYIMKWT